MKKVLIALAVILVLAVIVTASLLGKRGERGEKVYVEDAAPRDIVELVKASGQVDARVKVNISSHLIGKIEKLYVEEGDEVEARQPFLELEKEAFIAARDDWASRLAMAKNSVQQAQIALADSELKARRAHNLAEEGIITAEDLEAAELRLASARLELERAEESVLQAEANLVKARDDLAKTTLYSPLAGRVVSLRAEEGEVVVSGTMNNAASIIGTVADLSEILAVVDVDETEVARVSVGQDAELQVDALPDQSFEGRVIEVGSSGYSRAQQPDVTFFQVKLLFTEPHAALRPGMSVRADIRTASAEGALAVPIQAVVDRPPVKSEEDGNAEEDEGEEEEIPVVFVFDEGKAVQVPVTTGLTDDTHVAITAGLEGGEKVVTGPYRVLKDLENGDAVQIRSSRDKEDEEDDEES